MYRNGKSKGERRRRRGNFHEANHLSSILPDITDFTTAVVLFAREFPVLALLQLCFTATHGAHRRHKRRAASACRQMGDRTSLAFFFELVTFPLPREQSRYTLPCAINAQILSIILPFPSADQKVECWLHTATPSHSALDGFQVR